jgi:hypothetical protein
MGPSGFPAAGQPFTKIDLKPSGENNRRAKFSASKAGNALGSSDSINTSVIEEEKERKPSGKPDIPYPDQKFISVDESHQQPFKQQFSMGGKKPSVENLQLISQLSDHSQWSASGSGANASNSGNT